LVLIIILPLSLCARTPDDTREIPLSDLIVAAQEGQVERVEVDDVGDDLTVALRTGEEVRSRKERDVSMIELLENAGVDVGGPDGVVVEVGSRSRLGNAIGIVITLLPVIIVASVAWFAISLARRRSGG
jgi:ATP-dependent Zn protease